MLGQIRNFLFPALFALSALLPAGAGHAASSETFSGPALDARLVTAQDGIAGTAATLSAGLHLTLAEGWKTYWRSPGEVGIPPEIDWTGSTNVAGVEFLWPAPQRFSAFGIENFGYHDEVLYPLQITLERPGEPVALRAKVSLLTCSVVCVPQNFDLALSLPNGTGIDQPSADLIGRYLSRVPKEGAEAGVVTAQAFTDDAFTSLTVELSLSTALRNPDIFVELGEGNGLGKPDIRLGDSGRTLWAEIPILAYYADTFRDPVVTVTDGPDRAITVTPERATAAPVPPFSLARLVPGVSQVVWIAFIAFIGGLILNVMPCVLPVLSIKLSSAIKSDGRGALQYRIGFLAAAAGVMVFMWGLAATLFALQQIGVSVGWGLQFQNPTFLALMFVVLTVFAANLFGLFEISLPSGLGTRLAHTGGTSNYGADFATGVFGAVMATPCSAPFLGTAIAFALAGRGVDIAVVFTFLGLGLAMPYIAVAAFPRLVSRLPKPGRWMLVVKLVLGVLLAGTALWLLYVLMGVAGPYAMFTVLGLSLALVAALYFSGLPKNLRLGASVAFFLLPLIAAPLLATAPSARDTNESIAWIPFERGDIARRVSRGEVVFVDVTADWCLTCKANKALVLEREPVLSALNGPGVTPMLADWTRPDETIARFLEANNRYGIPFNAVYGPAVPEGIVLSEILSAKDVIAALDAAKGDGSSVVLLQTETRE